MNRILIGVDGSQTRRALRKELKRVRRVGAPVTFVTVCASSEQIDDARAALEPAMAAADSLGVDALRLLVVTGKVA